ncbi:hypothetical protein Tco_0196124 [Tanacetum coccineum]
MVNTRTDAELAAAVQAAVDAMLPQIREQVREEYRAGASGGNPPPATIHTWLERFNKQKPRSFEKAVAPVDAENWISHMEKIFDVMDCNDAFKTRLAVYKFEGDALAWWKAYKQAKGGDAWVLTLTWAAFKELFFLQFFPRAEQERLKSFIHPDYNMSIPINSEEQADELSFGSYKSSVTIVIVYSLRLLLRLKTVMLHGNWEILRDRDGYDRSKFRTRGSQQSGSLRVILTLFRNKCDVVTQVECVVLLGIASNVAKDGHLQRRDMHTLQLYLWTDERVFMNSWTSCHLVPLMIFGFLSLRGSRGASTTCATRFYDKGSNYYASFLSARILVESGWHFLVTLFSAEDYPFVRRSSEGMTGNMCKLLQNIDQRGPAVCGLIHVGILVEVPEMIEVTNENGAIAGEKVYGAPDSSEGVIADRH